LVKGRRIAGRGTKDAFDRAEKRPSGNGAHVSMHVFAGTNAGKPIRPDGKPAAALGEHLQ
jgi:hypothetical protein